MAAAHVQSIIESSTTTNHTVQLTNVAAGSTILVPIRTGSSSTWTVSDDVDGAYTSIVDETNVGIQRLVIFKLENASAGTRTITATTGASNTIRWGALEYSGVQAVAVEDTDSASFATTTTPATGNVTTTVNNSIVVGVLALDAATTTLVPNGGETERQEMDNRLQFQDEVAAAAGNHNSTWALGTTQPGIYAAIVLKATAATFARALVGGRNGLVGGALAH